MTAVDTARHSDTLRWLTRIGFIGYGLLHLALAWVALQIAFGVGGQEGDQTGAFQTLAAQPFGKFLLWFTLVALVLLAIWQAVLVIWGHRDVRGKERMFERAASAARVVIYLFLALTAGRVVTGTGQSTADKQQEAAAGIMAKPAGAWLVGLAGLAVLAFGLGMIWYGYKRKFEKKLDFGSLQHNARQTAIRAGRAGYAAKGVAFGIVGYLLIEAAIENDPAKSRGLDAALHKIVEQPYGKFLLIAVALGVALFGVYCFFQAKYRKVGS